MYVSTLFFFPRVVVELGVREGCSSFAFEGATGLLGADLYGFDLEQPSLAPWNMYAKLQDEGRGMFTQRDSVVAAQEWPEIVGKRIDVLYIDTWHTYNHTLNELLAWEPHLADKAMILLHDSNIPMEPRQHKDGREVLVETDNGVSWAIHDFTLTCWNPGEWTMKETQDKLFVKFLLIPMT